MEGEWKTLQGEFESSKGERTKRVRTLTEEENAEIKNFEKIESSTYQEVLKKAMLCITSESPEREDVILSIDQLSRIAEIGIEIPEQACEKCWEFIATDDDEISESASHCLYEVFRYNDKAFSMYGETLPSLLSTIIGRERLSEIHRKLFLNIILKNESTREICITEDLTGILLTKLTEVHDYDSLASVLEIIIGLYDQSPSLCSSLPVVISSVENRFCVENYRVYYSFLGIIYAAVSSSDSTEFICSFCESIFFQQIMSTISLNSRLGSKMLIDIMYTMMCAVKGEDKIRIHKALVAGNVFNVIKAILFSRNEELFRCCLKIASELFKSTKEFRVQFFSSDMPNFLLENFLEMASKSKRSVIRFLACISLFAARDEEILHFFIDNEILSMIIDNFDLEEITGPSIIIIKNVICGGIKHQGTDIYEEFIEQLLSEEFCDAMDDKIDIEEDDDLVSDLNDIKSVIETLKSQ